MAIFKQNLLPDEMVDTPPGVDIGPWIGPNDNIITIGTPDEQGIVRQRYIRDNVANVFRPQPSLLAGDLSPGPPPFETMPSGDSPGVVAAELAGPSPEALGRLRTFQRQYDERNSWRNVDPNYDEKRLKADRYYREDKDLADREMAALDRISARNRKIRQDFYPTPEEDRAWYDNVARLNADKPHTGPVNFTNIPGTAEKWAREGKSFGFLTNTPEETQQAIEKGYGKWGKIIGPPEAAITPKKAKPESPYPGAPPPEGDLTDLKNFDKFLSHLDQTGFLKKADLNINPVEARKAAEQPLKDQNAQFIYDYETYGAKQMGADSTARYNRLQKQIKEAGDLAEEGSKNAHIIARQNQALALDFFKAHRNDLSEKGKMSKEDQQELISMRQEMNSLRRDAKDPLITNKEKAYAQTRLTALQQREGQILKKEGGSPGQPGRSIERGLSYMKGITDKNEIIKRAQTLKTQYGWTREELNRLGKKLGL